VAGDENSSDQRTLRIRGKLDREDKEDETGPTRVVKPATERDEIDRARDLLALGLAESDDGLSLNLGLGGEGDLDDEDFLSARALHGRYKVKDLLGRGGMGEVHEVYDSVLDRHLAMKTVRVDNPEMLSRFILEARITSKLQHPNVPPVHDLGVGADGKHYFTMRRVRGKSLSALLRKGEAGTLIERLDIFRKICDAVAYAHSRGVIHRDLKPSNIMIGQFGMVLVLDWGLAKVMGDTATESMSMPAVGGSSGSGSHQTRLGAVMGTPAWMAPEQALGDTDAIDRCSDIFSLGAILFALLTGKPPFERRPAEILDESSAWEVEAPSETLSAKEVPRELDAVVLKAMARDPAERFESVEELRSEAQAFIERRPLASAKYSWLDRVGKWVSRHKAAVSAAMAVAAVALMLIAFGAWRYATDVNEARDLAVSEAERSRIAERDALVRLGEASVATSDALVRENRASEAHTKLVEARELFESLGRALLPIDLRLADIAGRFIAPARKWSAGTVTMLALRPDEAMVAVASENGRVTVWELPGASRLYEYDLKEHVRSGELVAIDWMKDEARALVSDGDKLSLIAIKSGEEIASVDQVEPGYHSISLVDGERVFLRYIIHGGDDRTWLPGDTRVRQIPWPKNFNPSTFRGKIAAGSASTREPVVELRDIDTGGLLWRQEGFGAAKLSADAILLTDMGGKEFALMDLKSRKARWTAEGSNVRRAYLSSDASRAFTVSGSGQIFAWSGDDGTLIAPLSGRSSAHGRLALGSRGQRVVGVLESGELALWHIGDQTGWSGLEPPSSGWGIDMSDAGDAVVTSCVDGQVLLFDTISGRALASVNVGEGARDLALSPDEAHVAIAGTDGQIWLWDLETGEAAPAFRADETKATSVAFLMQGKAIASVGVSGTIEIRSFPALRPLHQIEAHKGAIWTIETSPDGLKLLTTGRDEADGHVRVWDARTGKLLHFFEREKGMSVPFRAAWSIDGRRVAVARHSGVFVVWDLADGSTHKVQAHGGPAMGIAFSPDGSMIATTGYDGAVDFWDATTLAPLASFPRSREPIVDVAFNANGNTMVTSASDRQIQIWNLAESRGNADNYQRDAQLAVATEYWNEAAELWERSVGAGGVVAPIDRVRSLAMAGRLAEAKDFVDSLEGPQSATLSLRGWKLWLEQAKASGSSPDHKPGPSP
jgi:WD40 repeat protein